MSTIFIFNLQHTLYKRVIVSYIIMCPYSIHRSLVKKIVANARLVIAAAIAALVTAAVPLAIRAGHRGGHPGSQLVCLAENIIIIIIIITHYS